MQKFIIFSLQTKLKMKFHCKRDTHVIFQTILIISQFYPGHRWKENEIVICSE